MYILRSMAIQCWNTPQNHYKNTDTYLSYNLKSFWRLNIVHEFANAMWQENFLIFCTILYCIFLYYFIQVTVFDVDPFISVRELGDYSSLIIKISIKIVIDENDRFIKIIISLSINTPRARLSFWLVLGIASSTFSRDLYRQFIFPCVRFCRVTAASSGMTPRRVRVVRNYYTRLYAYVLSLNIFHICNIDDDRSTELQFRIWFCATVNCFPVCPFG